MSPPPHPCPPDCPASQPQEPGAPETQRASEWSHSTSPLTRPRSRFLRPRRHPGPGPSRHESAGIQRELNTRWAPTEALPISSSVTLPPPPVLTVCPPFREASGLALRFPCPSRDLHEGRGRGYGCPGVPTPETGPGTHQDTLRPCRVHTWSSLALSPMKTFENGNKEALPK